MKGESGKLMEVENSKCLDDGWGKMGVSGCRCCVSLEP